MLIDHARILYAKKCRDGQYIQSIDRLVKRSLPNLIKRDLTSKIRVYVVVEATVIRYDQYDFITDMQINKIIPSGKIGNFDMLECRNDHVIALMKIQKDIVQFKVGDYIPIRVGQSMYKIGDAHILVNGYPFIPYVPDQVYYSFGELSADDKDYYAKMALPLLKRELGRKEKLDKARWNEFSQLIHSFKTEQKIKKTVDIMEIDSFQNTLVCVDYHSNLSSLQVASVDSTDVEDKMIITDSPRMSLCRIAYQFVKWIETINDLTERYATDDAFESVKYVWDIYKEHKLE
jgi:hydrogenase maturation factor